MTIEEIKTSVTMAILKSASADENTFSIKLGEDVVEQCNIVGQFLGKKFMFFCLREAKECYNDQEKFDNLFAKFDLVGAKFTTNIEDSELDQIIADFDGEEN